MALAEAWIARGGRAVMALSEGAGVLEGRLAAGGTEVIRIAGEPGSAADAAATRRLADIRDAAPLVIDGYVFEGEYMAAVAGPAPLVAIEDSPRCAWYPVDMLVNQNLHAVRSDYAERTPGARLLLGPSHALIRAEFRRAREGAGQRTGGATRVLVTLGGADPSNVTRTAIHALQALAGGAFSVRVLVGPLNARADELARAAQAAGPHVELRVAPADVPALMAWADVAVSAAGSTTWELLYLGVPLVLVTLADNQRDIAASLGRAGVALELGWHADVTPSAIVSAVSSLASDHRRRHAMRDAGRAMVDGRGADRVAEAIGSLRAAGAAR
jgi:spore coat polysaccharide biosynthesis predicted glycosyltransferase SpsG